ncbi:dihydroorotase [Oscillatoria salina]|uniref:dihydroorotase n=1 Tax=Oscillatoria salina TaxID=331517 RepID=UPI0013BBAB2E|nr:dihydroorotase [Oscillatoria salina]MBZ8180131.1 dihydroorotase [Oscillatoria salina IIICB1]NET90757.1 dihydroorotase [Kamptonema sp. SIO1D9]
MNNKLLEQVKIIDPVANKEQTTDVLIIDGKIEAIATELKEVPETISRRDCRGLILAPGLVDLYSHSGEPGHEDRETLSSLAAAAIAGGFTRLTILPDTVPPLDNPSSLAWLKKGGNDSKSAPTLPHFSFWGALTQAMQSEQMTELADLAAAGAIGFTDGHPVANLGLLRRLLEYLQPMDKPVALMAADSHLKGNGVMREGTLSIRAGLPGDPEISEAAALAAILEVVAATGTAVHLMRISTARGVELIAEAKQRGLPVTASTTWMHLLLDSKVVASYDPNLRLEPPLGNLKDRETLVRGVKAGIVDAIAIDHTPYTYEEKTVAFACAPPGAIGLELALPLLWQEFVATKEWSALELWQALTVAPCRCLQQQPASFQVGEKAELILFDPEQTWTVNQSNLKSKSANTFWLGKQVTGKVLQVWNE